MTEVQTTHELQSRLEKVEAQLAEQMKTKKQLARVLVVKGSGYRIGVYGNGSGRISIPADQAKEFKDGQKAIPVVIHNREEATALLEMGYFDNGNTLTYFPVKEEQKQLEH